jgi:hypothetical protein
MCCTTAMRQFAVMSVPSELHDARIACVAARRSDAGRYVD